jgi:hypothetical protein
MTSYLQLAAYFSSNRHDYQLMKVIVTMCYYPQSTAARMRSKRSRILISGFVLAFSPINMQQ